MSSDEQRAVGERMVPAATALEERSAEAGGEAVSPRKGRPVFRILIALIIVLDAIAFVVVPPFVPGSPDQKASSISDLINANFELPAPHVVLDLDPANPPDSGAIVFAHPSISAPIFTSWVVMAVILLLAILATRRRTLVPGGVQNFVEFIYDALSNFAISLGGHRAGRYVPLFAGVFLFVLFSNWSGLLPWFGKIEAFRAPTSDVNITLGMALVVFVLFNVEGFRSLGVRGYVGKFFSLRGFHEGFFPGVISLYVGLIEFMLEFIKPITLSMRLFGNIFGGELALGVITALTIAIVPVALISLELLLNFVQALIFSVLTLMYTLIAIEGHDEEAHAAPEFAMDPEGSMGPPLGNLEVHGRQVV